MIPGYAGHLFAEDYVERLIGTPDVRRDAARLQRALSAWGSTASTLGPASSLRAVTELATLPLARLLGFEPDAAIALTDDASFVEARVGTERVLLVSSVLLVLVVELLNSSVEAAVDRIGLDTHRLSKRAKDLGSAAVLVALCALAIVWLALAGPVLVRLAAAAWAV